MRHQKTELRPFFILMQHKMKNIFPPFCNFVPYLDKIKINAFLVNGRTKIIFKNIFDDLNQILSFDTINTECICYTINICEDIICKFNHKSLPCLALHHIRKLKNECSPSFKNIIQKTFRCDVFFIHKRII